MGRSSVTLYGFEDKDGTLYGRYETFEWSAAKAYAQRYRLKVIAYEYTYDACEEVADYTDPDPDSTPQETP